MLSVWWCNILSSSLNKLCKLQFFQLSIKVFQHNSGDIYYIKYLVCTLLFVSLSVILIFNFSQLRITELTEMEYLRGSLSPLKQILLEKRLIKSNMLLICFKIILVTFILYWWDRAIYCNVCTLEGCWS